MNSSTVPRAVRPGIAVVVAALLVSACSVARLAYDQADWLLLREMDSYLDLREEQREQAAGLLAVSLRRHRSEQMPRFAAALREAAVRARRGLSAQDADWLMEHGRLLLVDTASELLPALAGTLAGLDAAQRAYLRERLAERNREWRDDHWLDRSREERFRLRAERAVERVERWTGPLSEEQVALVTQIRDAMPDSAAAWLDYTEAQQQRLLALLDEGAGAERIEAFLASWWLRFEDMSPEMARMRNQRLQGMQEMLVRLSESLDSVQRAHLVGRLESLAEDAGDLAREA